MSLGTFVGGERLRNIALRIKVGTAVASTLVLTLGGERDWRVQLPGHPEGDRRSS